MPEAIARAWRAVVLCAGLLAATTAAAAVDPDDLLPVDQAFALSAAADDDGIAVRWAIAPGYYLYRHRTKVASDAGFDAGALSMPRGTPKTDEFFGRVETYRGQLTARLPGTPRAARTVLTVQFQGCADVGVCYPPQTRRITVELPAAGADAQADSQADAPLAGLLPGRGAGLVNTAPGAGDGLIAPRTAQALPLPAERAFGFDALALDGRTLLLRWQPAPGYYLYRDNTTLVLDAASRRAGIALARPLWPAGRSHEDAYFGRTTVYFDPVEVRVPLRRGPGDAREAVLTATFQGCQDGGICYPPMTRTLRIALPAAQALPAGTDEPVEAVEAAPPDARPGQREGGFGDAATPPQPGAAQADAAVPPQPSAPGIAGPGAREAAPYAIGAPRGTALGLATALLLALLGGLVLNLMPCVLPVLSLKALALADTGQDAARVRRHALWYTAGVLASMLALGATALALREAGLALGWGFQLQQPLVVAALGLLMFALGLSLSGVWHVGGSWTGIGDGLTRRAGPSGDFATGVLAVVVATPCTAPFMGAALAWAFTADTVTALAVFAALGLGLALPFIAIGFMPALARRLPRPGPWMATFKQVLAFPMYLTAAWLAWVLARQRGADAVGWWLVAAVAVAFAAWAWTRSRHAGHRGGMAVALVGVLAVAAPLLAIHRLPRPATTATVQDAGTVAFSEARLASLRAAGRPVFVNVTADWCITCKANERAVLSRAAFRTALEEADAVYMVGDWTDVDPALTAFLQRHRAVGVPLYVVYPAGDGPAQVLPTVLTLDTVRDALRAAAAP